MVRLIICLILTNYYLFFVKVSGNAIEIFAA